MRAGSISDGSTGDPNMQGLVSSYLKLAGVRAGDVSLLSW